MTARVASRTWFSPNPLVGMLAALLLVAGCADVPESLDPTTILDDDEPVPDMTRIEVPPDESDRSYPNLAQVPSRPEPISSFSERQALQDELAGDYERANFSTDPLQPSVKQQQGLPPGITLGPGPAAVVTFANGVTELSSLARAELERVAAAQEQLGSGVRIVGYSDSGAGDPLRAFRLSAERAEAVAAQLRRLGVPSGALVTQAVAADARRFGSDPQGGRAEIFLDIGTASR